jgi:hypothetical protein
MPRTHGYALKGNRCFGTHDWGTKGRTNVIRALLGGVLLTVSLFQTTVDTLVFNAWVLQDLMPKLPDKSIIVTIMQPSIRAQQCDNPSKEMDILFFTYTLIHLILIQSNTSGLKQSQ